MTQGFDEYWDKENARFDDGYHKHKETYDLGVASRQDEIDELKERINDTLNTIESSEEISHMLYGKVYKILKGESNER